MNDYGDWRSSVYCLLPTCRVYAGVRMKFLAPKCLLPYFFLNSFVKGIHVDNAE